MHKGISHAQSGLCWPPETASHMQACSCMLCAGAGALAAQLTLRVWFSKTPVSFRRHAHMLSRPTMSASLCHACLVYVPCTVLHCPAGSYNCLQGLRPFIQWEHPRVRVAEAKPATITLPPCTKAPIILQRRQARATMKQKIRQDQQYHIKLAQQAKQQAWLDAAVKKWCRKHGQDGPQTPFVTVSYEDKYTKVSASAA